MIKLFAILGICIIASLRGYSQPGVLQFSEPLFSASEATFVTQNNTNFLVPTVVVTRTGGSTGAVSANYSVWINETTDNAVESQNYNLSDNTRGWVAAGTLTWENGDSSSKTLPFMWPSLDGLRYNLRPSPLVQGTITYTGRLVTPTGGATLGQNVTTRLEITDAQGPSAGVINLNSRRYYGPDGGSVVVTVRRDGGTSGAVSVNYATSSSLPAIGANQQNIGAAIAGTHYTAASGTITWASGDNAVKTFTIALPATGTTTGLLNLSINLSAPTNGAVLGTVPSALLTIQNLASTIYNINDNIDSSTYRVSLPPGPGAIRGVLFWWPGTRGDDRHFTTDPNFRRIADQWRFAIASPRSNYTGKPNRFDFQLSALPWFFNRLDQMAKSTGRPEIANAPFVISGMSAGSYDASHSLHVWPERTIAILAHQGWTELPWDLPLNYEFNSITKEIPLLNLGGQIDGTQSPPSRIFPAMSNHRKKGLTRSASVMCWGRPHTFGDTSSSYNSFGLYWLDQVMTAGRYLSSSVPSATAAPVLGSIPISSGWWGVRNSTNNETTSPPYGLSGGSSRFLEIGPDLSFTGIKDTNNTLVDSWLPTESTARAYRAFVSLPSIVFATPAQFSLGNVGAPTTLAVNENGFGNGLTKIEFYDENTKIGEDTSSPYGMSWIPTTSGARSITAVASNVSGPLYTAFNIVIVAAPQSPTISLGQSVTGNISTAFSYQIASLYAPTRFTLVSGSLPLGLSLSSSGLISGIPTQLGVFNPVINASNGLGVSPSVGISITINPLIVTGPATYDSFSYTSGVGALASQNGGDQWIGAWDGGSNDIQAPGLVFSPGLSLITAGGKAVVKNGGPNFRSLSSSPLANGTYWISFLARSTSPGNNWGGLSLFNRGSEFLFIGQRNGASNWGVERSGGGAINSSSSTGNVTFLVAKIVLQSGNDSVFFWVDPILGSTPLDSDAIQLANVNDFTFNRIRLQQGFSAGQILEIDEVRFGGSYQTVTPVSAPTIVPGQMVTGNQGQAFSYGIAASENPTSWAISSGNLPAGVSLNVATGTLSGTPTTAGNFTPSFTASNAGGTSLARMVDITIFPALTALQVFRNTHGLDINGADDLLIPANDGVVNLLKFAFNMVGNGNNQKVNLLLPNSAILRAGVNAGLPSMQVDDVGKLKLTYIRCKSTIDSGITYTVEFSTELSSGSWASDPSATMSIPEAVDTYYERVTVTSSFNSTRRFVRIRITAL